MCKNVKFCTLLLFFPILFPDSDVDLIWINIVIWQIWFTKTTLWRLIVGKSVELRFEAWVQTESNILMWRCLTVYASENKHHFPQVSAYDVIPKMSAA